MLIIPNHPLAASIRGRIGNLVFQRHHASHLVRCPWTIRARSSTAQEIHRLAVQRSTALYHSVHPTLAAAWSLYADPLPYSPYAAWHHLNIAPVKAGAPSCIAPPNPAYAPISGPSWTTARKSQVRADWTYPGPAETVLCSLYARPSNVYTWTLRDTVDAADETATISGLEPGQSHELALLAHDAGFANSAEAFHAFADAGTDPLELFLTWTEIDPTGYLTPQLHSVFAAEITRDDHWALYDDKGAEHFGPAWAHDFEWEPVAYDNNASSYCWCLANSVHDAYYWGQNNSQAITLGFYHSYAIHRVNLYSCENGSQQSFDDYAYPATYYVSILRTSETAVEARLYTDPERTNLKHTHQITIPSGRRYRYVFSVNTPDTGSPERSTFHVRNLDLHELD